MKIALALLGTLVLVSIFLVVRYFTRLGKPVNEGLSHSYYYDRKGEKVIYSPMGNWFELGYHETDADPTSFVVLSTYAGKDSKTVYWKGKKTQADPGSFIIDSNRIPKDKFHVYFPCDYPDSLYVIEGADPATYQSLPILNERYWHHWDVDATSIFLDGKKVEADRATFVRSSSSIATDISYVYSIEASDSIAAGSPGATILVRRGKKPDGEAAVINENYARIGHSIVHSGWQNKFSLLPFDKINSIRVLDERNILVDGILISDGKRIEGIDEVSLEIIGRDFFKDKNSVYYLTEKIPGANPKTFLYVWEEYAKDDQHVFYKTQVLEGVKPNTFTIDYPSGIASDGNLSFKDGQLVTTKK